MIFDKATPTTPTVFSAFKGRRLLQSSTMSTGTDSLLDSCCGNSYIWLSFSADGASKHWLSCGVTLCSYIHTHIHTHARVLTQQRNNTAQDGHERPGAEAGGGVRHGAARQRHTVRVAVAHAHRQRVGAAEGGIPAVHNQHGQSIHRLLTSAEASPLGQYGGCVVWKRRSKEDKATNQTAVNLRG